MIKPYLIPILMCLFSMTEAQSDLTTLRGNRIDPKRYAGIKNTPYLFQDWTTVSIIPSSGAPIEGVEINFNGYTQNFECRVEGQVIELELGYFIGMKVEGLDSMCGRQSFLKYYHPKLTNKYPLFVFNGKKHRLIKDFRATLVENKVETPGKTEKFKSFGIMTSYYILTGAEIEVIRLNRNYILDHFSSPGLQIFIDENNINPESEAGLCQILEWQEHQP